MSWKEIKDMYRKTILGMVTAAALMLLALPAFTATWNTGADWWWNTDRPADNPWHHGYYSNNNTTYTEMGSVGWWTYYDGFDLNGDADGGTGRVLLHNPGVPFLCKSVNEDYYFDGYNFVLSEYVAIASQANCAGIFRWVAPTSSQISIDAIYMGAVASGDNYTRSYFKIRHNGVDIYSDLVEGFYNPLDGNDIGPNSHGQFNGLLNVAAGDTIDFTQISGPDGGGHTLQFDATISTVPEPSSVVSILGLLGTMGFAIRRKK